MKSTIFLSAITALLTLNTNTAALPSQSAKYPKDPKPKTNPFTSTWHITGTPDQVVNATGHPTGGLPGATGTYLFGLDSRTNTICYHITLYGFEGEYQSPARTSTHIHNAAKGVSGPPRVVFPDPVEVDEEAEEKKEWKVKYGEEKYAEEKEDEEKKGQEDDVTVWKEKVENDVKEVTDKLKETLKQKLKDFGIVEERGKETRRVSVGCLTGPFTTGVKDAKGMDTGEGFHVKFIEEKPELYYADVHSSLAVPGANRGQFV